jgi:hypothetical protein
MQTSNWLSDAGNAVGGFFDTFEEGVKNLATDLKNDYEMDIYNAEHPTGANKEFQQAFDATSVGREVGEAADTVESTLEDGDMYIPGRELLSKANDLLKKINPLLMPREEQPIVPLTGTTVPPTQDASKAGVWDATSVISTVLPGADAGPAPALNDEEIQAFRNAKTKEEVYKLFKMYDADDYDPDTASAAEFARMNAIIKETNAAVKRLEGVTQDPGSSSTQPTGYYYNPDTKKQEWSGGPNNIPEPTTQPVAPPTTQPVAPPTTKPEDSTTEPGDSTTLPKPPTDFYGTEQSWFEQIKGKVKQTIDGVWVWLNGEPVYGPENDPRGSGNSNSSKVGGNGSDGPPPGVDGAPKEPGLLQKGMKLLKEAMAPVEETQATVTQERVSALRPFMPLGAEDDVNEQGNLQSDRLKQDNLQLGQFLPQGWPLGGTSNPLHVANILHEYDIRYMGAMDPFIGPPIYSGGTMDEETTLYGEYPIL